MVIPAASTILGTIAASFTTVAFVPQIRRIVKTGGRDVSYQMLMCYLVGVALWWGYGLIVGATAVSWANALSIVFVATCIWLKLMKDGRMAASSPARRKKARIAIDMDETIANSLKEHLLRFRATFGVDLSEEELRGKNIEDLVPENQRAAVRRLVRDETFFEDLELIDGAREVVRDLAAEHEVFIVSAAMEVPESFAAKHRWLLRHFPFIPGSNLVFCGDKRIIDADYLIDDLARHFQGFRGTGILFSAPHNAGVTGCCRVENWQQIRHMFLNPLKPLNPGAHVCPQVDRNGKAGLLHDSLG
jgi:5'-nucleotidase